MEPKNESDLTTPSFPGRAGRVRCGSGQEQDRQGQMAPDGTTCKFNLVAAAASAVQSALAALSAAAAAAAFATAFFVVVVVGGVFDDDDDETMLQLS